MEAGSGRKTIIVGNGLGMALDQESFQLANAIKAVWDDPDFLTDEEKQCILECLPRPEDDPPRGEEELDVLQVAVTACSSLSRLEGGKVEWLSPNGRDFPAIVSKFIFKVASYLHLTPGDLPAEFVGPLASFLGDTRSHVATLNYDRLLYDAICQEGLVGGYDGALVDGMTKAGFKRENLERRFGKEFGYYLHLHGSPLFYGDVDAKKLGRNQLKMETECDRPHIVLTNIKHKMSVIESSEVLSSYWAAFGGALAESEEVILIGYAGEDEHLNQRVKSSFSGKPTRVVEWIGAGPEDEREAYWKEKLGAQTELIQLDNILEFTDWKG
jgi:hypothetical protein